MDTSGFAIDREACTIRFERDFRAEPARVFDAWTKPEQLARWWDPEGHPLVTCHIDLRVGGAFRFVSRGHSDMPFSGVYREIAPPERLAFEALGAIGRVNLKRVANGTHMLVEIICSSQQQLDEYLKMGVHMGTSQTLDNLVGYVA